MFQANVVLFAFIYVVIHLPSSDQSCVDNTCKCKFLALKVLMREITDISSQLYSEIAIHDEIAQISKNSLGTKYYPNCNEALRDSDERGAVVMLSLRASDLEPFNVYCMADPEGQSPWLIFQRRSEGNVDFEAVHYWYQDGFGNVADEYWLGLNQLHAITYSEPHELWIQMQAFNGEWRYAKYNLFAVNSEERGYALSVLGDYEGDAGDSLSKNIGQKFSSKDNDADNSTGHCSQTHKGGWWFNNCGESNLNGKYGKNTKAPLAIMWQSWKNEDPKFVLKYAHMAIRPLYDDSK